MTIFIFFVTIDVKYANIYSISDPGVLLIFHGRVRFSPCFTITGLLLLKFTDSPLAETLEKGNHVNENKEKLSVDYCPVFVNYSSGLKLISG